MAETKRQRAWRWLKWLLLCPIRWEALEDIRAVKARYEGEQPPVRALFRLYHPAFWVVFWQLMWVGRRTSFRGKWLKWFVWCGGGFVEMLITRRVPGVEE